MIVTDDIGNRNNLLTVPIHKVAAQTDTSDKVDLDSAMAENQSSVDEQKLRVDESASDIMRSSARTPDIASNAAEVADSAMILDRDEPTPSIPDDEAGRIGFRRMSLTPIPQVAETAAEVADTAALLDEEEDEDNMVRRPLSASLF